LVGGGNGTEDSTCDLIDEFEVKVFLRVEVLVQQWLRDASCLGHIVHGGRLKSTLCKVSGSDLEELLSTLFTGKALGRGLRSRRHEVQGYRSN
jgi:hypothetical protein